MKTLFFLASIGGLAYWTYTDAPAVHIKKVDWENRKITTAVRGSTVVIDADTIFRTNSSMVAPIAFSKYTMTASQNQTFLGAPAVVRISITEGNTLIGQSDYVDFDMQLVNGHAFENSK